MFPYSYFAGVVVMLIIWSILYFRRADLRKPMLVFSTTCGIAGFFSALLYNQDWWLPLTITHTFVGIEDLLFGFTISGIAGTILLHITNTRLSSLYPTRIILQRILIMAGIAYLIFIILFIVGIHSFIAGSVAGLGMYGILIFKQPRLLVRSLGAGLLTLIALLPAYWIPELLNPGWLTDSWMIHNLTGITLLGIVIEDIIWVIIAGAACYALFRWSSERHTQPNL